MLQNFLEIVEVVLLGSKQTGSSKILPRVGWNIGDIVEINIEQVEIGDETTMNSMLEKIAMG